jgi:hypothetical protein
VSPEKDTPGESVGAAAGVGACGSVPQVGGLHHRYERRPPEPCRDVEWSHSNKPSAADSSRDRFSDVAPADLGTLFG